MPRALAETRREFGQDYKEGAAVWYAVVAGASLSHDWLRDRSCFEFGVLCLDLGVPTGEQEPHRDPCPAADEQQCEKAQPVDDPIRGPHWMVRAGGRRGAAGERRVHGDGGGRGCRRPGGMAGHVLRSRSLAVRGGGAARAAAGRVAADAGRWPGGEPERDPRRGRGAPGPQAVERAASRRRPAGHRFRHLPGGGIHRADAGGPGDRLTRVYVPRAGHGL